MTKSVSLRVHFVYLFVCLFDMLLYVHGNQLRSCRNGQLSYKTGQASLQLFSVHSFDIN